MGPVDRVILTSDLSKHYGNRIAVNRLSLQVRQGEIYGFLGLNGAGKTTTIRLLLGMIRPSEGAAWIFGVRPHPDALDLWARVGYVVEAPSAYPELTVRENLEVFRRLRRVTDPKAVEQTIERLGLGSYADHRAGTLSRGNRQRLGLARALLHEPELLILDEPVNGLDPAGIAEVRELLLELVHRRGVTVFMSSHLLSEVARIATRIGVIHEGRLSEELDAEELERRCHRWLVVDARDCSAAQAILQAAGFAVAAAEGGKLVLTDARVVACPDDVARLLVEKNVRLTRLSVEQEDLESYFLRLIGAARGGER